MVSSSCETLARKEVCHPENTVKQLVEFEFEFQQEVTIKQIETKGHVIARMQDSTGIQYHIAYWNNGERKTEWMYRWELK
jgi:hypothetical protein